MVHKLGIWVLFSILLHGWEILPFVVWRRVIQIGSSSRPIVETHAHSRMGHLRYRKFVLSTTLCTDEHD